LVVLQNLADSEKIQDLSEICPATSHDAYQAVGIKAEVFSDAEEEEEYPIPETFLGIKVEPEVSCVSVRWISEIHRYPLFYELHDSKQLTFIRGFFSGKTEKYICSMGQVGSSRHHLPGSSTIQVCTHALF
jgi:hypothetical protein